MMDRKERAMFILDLISKSANSEEFEVVYFLIDELKVLVTGLPLEVVKETQITPFFACASCGNRLEITPHVTGYVGDKTHVQCDGCGAVNVLLIELVNPTRTKRYSEVEAAVLRDADDLTAKELKADIEQIERVGGAPGPFFECEHCYARHPIGSETTVVESGHEFTCVSCNNLQEVAIFVV